MTKKKCPNVHNISSLSTATANWSCSFPGSLTIVAFSEASILYTWYPRMTPDAEKERGTAVAVAMSHYQRCVNHIANVPLYINGDRHRSLSTFGARLIHVTQQ